VTAYSRQVSEVGEYGPAANDGGAPATAGKKAAPEPEPKTTTKAKAAAAK